MAYKKSASGYSNNTWIIHKIIKHFYFFILQLVNILWLAFLAVNVRAKPSISHFDFPLVPDHFDFAPPVLPPSHFHAATPFAAPAPAPLLPAAVLPAPARVPFALPSAPHLPLAPVHFAAAPLPVHHIAEPAPFVHTPVVPAPAFPAPLPPLSLPVAKVLPPVFEPVPFAVPRYHAIPGPKTTTHHVSVGYAFPSAPLVTKFAHHQHHSLF